MSIIDDIRIKQTYDPTGENGGYHCETGLEDDSPIYFYSFKIGSFEGFETQGSEESVSFDQPIDPVIKDRALTRAAEWLEGRWDFSGYDDEVEVGE